MLSTKAGRATQHADQITSLRAHTGGPSPLSLATQRPKLVRVWRLPKSAQECPRWSVPAY